MSQVEIEPVHEAQRFMDDLLAWQPPLPIGELDLGPLLELSPGQTSEIAEEPGYAWERLPRFLSETREPFDKTTGPIVTLDVCSSLPLYAQLLRVRQFARSRARSAELVRGLTNNNCLTDLGRQDDQLRDLAVAAAQKTAGKKRQVTIHQQILESIVQEAIYTRPANYSADQLYTDLATKLASQTSFFRRRKFDASSPESNDLETRWQMHFDIIEGDTTYRDRLAEMRIRSPLAKQAGRRLSDVHNNAWLMREAQQTQPAGTDLANRLVDWQARQLANEITTSHRYRTARFLSMDLADPTAIASSSIANTPQSTQSMDMFPHAVSSLLDGKRHLRGNALEPLPVPDRSLALITCFDGWPFHFSIDSYSPQQQQELSLLAVSTLKNWYDKLVYGGKIVIFPWAIEGGGQHAEQVLTSVAAELGRLAHIGIDTRLFHRDTLEDWMSDSDRQVANSGSSRIFSNGNSYFHALVVEKPDNKDLAERSYKKLGGTPVASAKISIS